MGNTKLRVNAEQAALRKNNVEMHHHCFSSRLKVTAPVCKGPKVLQVGISLPVVDLMITMKRFAQMRRRVGLKMMRNKRITKTISQVCIVYVTEVKES